MYTFNTFESNHYGYREYTFVEDTGNGVMIFRINTNSLIIDIKHVITNPNCPAIIADLFNELDKWIKENRPETKEMRFVTDNREIITLLIQRDWTQDKSEESSTMTYVRKRNFQDTFGASIKVNDEVVFILNGPECKFRLGFGKVTSIDNKYIYIRNDADGIEYFHVGCEDKDPTIQVRCIEEV